MMRELVGPAVQFAIGQLLLLKHQRHLVRRSRSLLFDQLVQAVIFARVIHRRLIPAPPAIADVRRQ